MKKIIHGRTYDTATARRLCAWSPTGDHANSETTLFRKRSGECFLGCWHNLRGTDIVPLRRESALRYAELHMDADEYETEFGEVPE